MVQSEMDKKRANSKKEENGDVGESKKEAIGPAADNGDVGESTKEAIGPAADNDLIKLTPREKKKV